MVTIEKLNEFGANTTEGLERCMGNADLYLKLVQKFLDDDSFKQLKEAIANDNLEQAFQCSHALKGVLANLSLDPLFEIVSELTELLRNKTQMDYSIILNKYESKLKEINMKGE